MILANLTQKAILAFTFLALSYSLLQAQIQVAYVVNKTPLAETAALPGQDLIVTALEGEDIHFTKFVISDASGLDFSGFDVVIAQAPLHSSDDAWKTGGALDFGTLEVPMIYNNMWGFQNGRAVTSGGGTVYETGELALNLVAGREEHELFRGIPINEQSFRMFVQSTDNTGEAGDKAFNYATGVRLDFENTLLAVTSKIPEKSSTLFINDIPAGSILGDRPTKSRMIVLGINPGTIMADGGKNLKSAGLTMYRNAIYLLADKTVPDQPVEVLLPHQLQGAVAYWTFDEVLNKTVIDELGNANGQISSNYQITHNGDPASYGYGSFLYQDFEKAFIIDDNELFDFESSFSISFLMQLVTWEQSRTCKIFQKGNSGKTIYNLSSKNGYLNFHVGDGVNTTDAELYVHKLTPDQSLDWVHTAIVRDRKSRTVKIYLNGKLYKEVADNTKDYIDTKGTPFFFLNGYSFDTQNACFLDEIQIINRAITTEEVELLNQEYDLKPIDWNNEDPSLKSMTIGGKLVLSFDPEKFNYVLKQNEESVLDIEQILFQPNDPNATVQVIYPFTFPGRILVNVTSENGLHQAGYEVYIDIENQNETYDILYIGDSQNPEDRKISQAMRSWGYTVRLIEGPFYHNELHENYRMVYMSQSTGASWFDFFASKGYPIPALITNVESLENDNVQLGTVRNRIINADSLVAENANVLIPQLTANEVIPVYKYSVFNRGKIVQYDFELNSKVRYKVLAKSNDVEDSKATWALIEDFPGNENHVELIIHGYSTLVAKYAYKDYWNQIQSSVEFLIGKPTIAYNLCSPTFKEIYDYEVGDVFEVEETNWTSYGGWFPTEVTTFLYEIKSKSIHGDSLIYNISGVKKITYSCKGDAIDAEPEWCVEPIKYKQVDEVLIYVDSANHFLNACNHDLINSRAFSDKDGYWSEVVSTDSTVSIGDSYYRYDENFNLVKVNVEVPSLAFGTGVGMRRGNWSYADYGRTFELKGYVKNGDTVGVITLADLPLTFEEKLSNVNFYPNPTTGVLHLEGLGLGRQVEFEIIDLSGRVLMKPTPLNQQLDISCLQNGTYILKIHGSSSVQFNKVVLRD